MALQFTNTAEQSATNGAKVLVYSLSGVGKTTLCATAPRPVIISNESGLLSLSKANLERLYGVDTPGITYNIPVIKITDMADLLQAYAWCSTSVEAANFDTVCLDSISEMAESVLNNAKRNTKDPRQAYGDLIVQTEDVVRKFRDLPGKHVYMAAKLATIKDEFTGSVKYGISMPGSKLGPALPYFFDEVFRLAIGVDPIDNTKKFRYLQTQPDMQYEAKDRSGALDAMEYPHLGNIFSKITGV